MKAIVWITGALLSAIPFFIAYKRKCRHFVLIDLLAFCLSWTIIGWIVAMCWAITDESDPEAFAKQTRVRGF